MSPKQTRGGWKSFPHVLSWDPTDWRLVSDGWVAICTIATIATKYCFYCSGGWMGGNTITIVGGNAIAIVGGNTIATT